MKSLPKISVIVPTLNEEGNVLALVQRLDQTLGRSGRFTSYEVIFIDDHSTDRTVEIIQELRQSYPVSVYTKVGRCGKAYSLWEGFALAKYEIIAIIDADLQYAPEDILSMAEKLGPDADVVQSRRIERKEKNQLRNLASQVFNFVFIRSLHGLNLDTQSGLKVFYRKILNDVHMDSATPWTFDLEFLIKVQSAGYKIVSHDIEFSERNSGQSKVRILQTSLEIGWNALKLKFQGTKPRPIRPTGERMIGSGQTHKGRRYITHSTLPHEISAIITFAFWQKVAIAVAILIVVGCAYFWPLTTAIVVVAVLSFIYFLDVLFNFFLISSSLSRPPELSFTNEALAAVDMTNLPVYSILCPLYREAHVLPGFLESIAKLDWPKDRLDVQLLLEEDDQATIQAARDLDLPDYVRVIVVPHSLPKTKPKACNYGLSLARGEFLVIYDAEDVPEPEQLKKAYLGFAQVGRQVMCLQAKLNYFNPHHNLLTRLFTAEYSLWFDVVLPGLQSINGYIPLGGTSNHFRTADLQQLHGWDAFNVTEDCDLGARLFKAGYTTAIINSTTLEEANSNLRNWIRQRSRWIKGYMQTYLVHMRHPVKFVQESGIHAVIFQLVVGGKIAFMLINPILWLMTISYFVLRTTLGPTIEALFPPVIFYIAVSSLLIGNFMYLYYYMIGCAKREHWSVIKYVYLVPVYWLMTSWAAVIALYQLIVKPHFWEKTNHGLHLKKAAEAAAEEELDAKPTVKRRRFAFGKIFGKYSPQLWSGGTILLLTMFLTSFLNFLYNAFLGRVLSLEQLAVVVLVNTLWSLLGLFFSAVSTTINHRTAYLTAEGRLDSALAFRRRTLYSGLLIVGIFSAFWIMVSPFTSHFLNLADPWVILLFVPMFTFGFMTVVNSGFLQGQIQLVQVAKIYIFESVVKFIAAGIFVWTGLHSWAYISIPISVVAVSLFTIYLFRTSVPKPTQKVLSDRFPKLFYTSALFSVLSSTVFMNLDVLLVNHFLPAKIAGAYSLLSLVGKMVFYFGSLPNSLMLTFVSRDLGSGKNPNRTFYLLLAVTTGSVSLIALFLGVFGNRVVPLLLGSNTLSILSYIPAYVFAMAVFTVVSSFVTYHLARKQYIFPFISLLMSLCMAYLIVVNHANVSAIVNNILLSSLLGLVLVISVHLINPSLKFASRLFHDLLDVFQRPKKTPFHIKQKRILIFNWRDTKHVYAGGAEVYIQEMATRWVRAGNSVTIFSGNDGKSLRSETVDGVNIIRRGGFYFVYFWAFVYYIFQFRGNFDVIIDCQNGVPFFTPLYAREQIFCLMHHVHQNVFTRSLSKPLALFARFLEKDLMPLVYRNVKFITISNSSRTQMLELGLGRAGIHVVNPGVNLGELSLGEKSVDPTVVYLGRLKAYKSVDVLIKAFFMVVSKVKNAQLIIAGNGEEEANLRKLVTKMDLDKSVKFAGKVSDKEKTTILQRAWVFVNPSFMEGWGITTVEANACGTPIVAANVPGLRDSVLNPHTGFLVKHGDYAAFAEKIMKLIDDEELRKQMGLDAREWAENFDWSKSSDAFLGILKNTDGDTVSQKISTQP